MNKILLICLFLGSLSAFGKGKVKLPSNVDKTEHWTLTSTYYHAVKSQTDDTPLITANNTKINPSHVKSGKQKIVAFSRDLFKLGFKLGDKVYIEELGDYYEVADTMNKRYTRHVDVLIHTSHKPMPYTKLTIRKVIT